MTEVELNKLIGMNIKKFRELNNLSIEELSSKSQVEELVIKEIESLKENIEIKPYDLYRISVVLGNTVEDYLN